MQVDSIKLLEFVGIVLPVSFIGLRILLDELDETTGVSVPAKERSYMNHALAMVVMLVTAAWLAILDILFAGGGVPLAKAGYVSAAAGITVPVWLLRSLRTEFVAT